MGPGPLFRSLISHTRLSRAERRLWMTSPIMTPHSTAGASFRTRPDRSPRGPIKKLRLLRPAPSPFLAGYAEVRVTYHPSSLHRNREWSAQFDEDIGWLSPDRRGRVAARMTRRLHTCPRQESNLPDLVEARNARRSRVAEATLGPQSARKLAGGERPKIVGSTL